MNENEKKQIEEMRKDLVEIFDEEYEKRRLITADNTAEKMTAKGYRKQSEGEWIVEAYKGDEIVVVPYIKHQHDEPFCSLCGKYALLDGGEEYVVSNYCPHCGAKMKGGEE